MLQVESDGLICVSVNPIMPLFIIILSLPIYLTRLESDIKLSARTITVSIETAIVFTGRNK